MKCGETEENQIFIKNIADSNENKEETENFLRSRFLLCFGGVGGIRTLGRLLTVTRFPVVLVMTSSIPLHKAAASNSLLILHDLS